MRAREEGGERKKPSIDISKNDIKKEVEVVKSKIQDKIKQMPTEKKKQIIIAVCSSLFYFCFYYRIPSRSQGPLQGCLIATTYYR